MKKLLAVLLTLCVLCSLFGAVAAQDDFKVGLICVHDENTGYDEAHMHGFYTALEELGVPNDEDHVKVIPNIPESEECYDACVDLAEWGANLVISDSYGHQAFTAQAAAEYPEISFIAATGDTAWKEELENFGNMFPHTYESRYVSGVVAGLKLAEMLADGSATDPYIGYVGAYPYAEVKSGYTGFFLGIRSIVPDAHMDVIYTNSWFDPTAEYEAANALMARGCVIIGQHADSTGAPLAVQEAKDNGKAVYSVGYNIDMLQAAPTAALTSAQNNWSVLYKDVIARVMAGEGVLTDVSYGYAEGANMISQLGPEVAEGTADKVAEIEAAIKDGSLKVFDTKTFTVAGEEVTQCFALDSDGDWAPDTYEAIVDGYFHESEAISAPAFAFVIDGITEITN